MSRISNSMLTYIKHLYYDKKLHMAEIAKILNVSVDSLVYFMRKHKLDRRNLSQINLINLQKRALSYSYKIPRTTENKLLEAVGVMLYWAEGYKTDKSSGIDFANSDPAIIAIFIKFLRKIFIVDETRFRLLIYSYSDQNLDELRNYWSDITKIPINQFSKPYVKNANKSKRVMKYGLVHIRYYDKRLLSEMKKLIESYKSKYAPVV